MCLRHSQNSDTIVNGVIIVGGKRPVIAETHNPSDITEDTARQARSSNPGEPTQLGFDGTETPARQIRYARDPEDDSPTCEVCKQSEDDCNCWTCKGCDNRKSEDDSSCELCRHCGECCNCWTCRGCDKARAEDASKCNNCEGCENCCECYYCEGCNSRVRESCGDCEMCTDCCSCNGDGRKGPRVKQHFRIEHPDNLKGYRTNKLRRAVSVELELSEISDPDTLVTWAENARAGLVEDGSIPTSGCEINTNPASGDLFLSRIASMIEAIEGCESNDSCGLHVHVGASDYGQYDLRKLIMLWAGVESSMYELIARTRFQNNYCKVSASDYVNALVDNGDNENCTFAGKARTWNERIASVLYESNPRDAKSACKREKYDGRRYYGLNIHSFFFRKTIEVRLHEGTTDGEKLKHWPLVCGHIVDYASKATEKQILAMLHSEMSSEDILLAILPPYLREWVSSTLKARREARSKYGSTEETREFLFNVNCARIALITGKAWKENHKISNAVARVRASTEVFAYA